MRDYKLVVLGAGGVGKSSITVQFVQGVYVESYDPTIEDSYRKQIEVDGRACDLEILDTAGVAQFTAMRELYIKSGKGFLLVYSVTDPTSLQELESIRQQLVRIKDTENVPMALIGNKCDLEEERKISAEDGIAMSQNWGKVPFYETSAMYKTNVEEAFVDVVRQIIRKEVSANVPQNGTAAAAAAAPNDQYNKDEQTSQHGAGAAGGGAAGAGSAGAGIAAGQSPGNGKRNSQGIQQPKKSNTIGSFKKNNNDDSKTNKKKKKKRSKCVIL